MERLTTDDRVRKYYALSHYLRYDTIMIMARYGEPLSTGFLASSVGVTDRLMRFHLSILKNKGGFITRSKFERTVYWEINEEEVQYVIDDLILILEENKNAKVK